jgi:hypothetical protein
MTRAHLALAALALVAGAFAVAFAWQPGLASIYDDSVSYLIMAQAFSPWSAASDAVLAAWPAQKYPPLFPMLLALGGGASDWRIAHAWVAASFAASVFLLGIHARNVTGSARLGFAAALAYAWLPGTWLNMKGILSEFPFTALALAALVWQHRLRAGPASRRYYLVLGLILSAALLTRTIGVALVAAVAVAGIASSRRTAARAGLLPWAVLPPIVLAGLWYVVRPKGGEDAYVAFSAGMAQGAAEHGVAWALSIMGFNASALADAWYNALLIYWGEPWRPAFIAASFVGLSAAAGSIARAWKGEADGLYVLASAAILVAWPFPGQMYRLALPLIPLLLVHALWLWERAAARFAGEESARRMAPYAAMLPLALGVPAVVFYIAGRAATGEEVVVPGYRVGGIAEFYRIPDRRSAEENARQQIGIFADLEQVRRTTPGGARVMWYAPDYVALLAGRRGVALARSDAAAMAAQMRAARPDYIYFAAVHPRDSAGRLGNPLDGVSAALPFADAVWQRVGAQGRLESVLLRVDAARLATAGQESPASSTMGRP